jgi:hypothetical protein
MFNKYINIFITKHDMEKYFVTSFVHSLSLLNTFTLA